MEVVDRKASSFWDLGIVLASTRQLLHGNSTSLHHTFLSLSNPHSRIIEFLVGLVSSSRVTNLALEEVVLFSFKVLDAFPVTPLSVTVDLIVWKYEKNIGNVR